MVLENKKYEILTDEGWKDFKYLSVNESSNIIKLITETSFIECTEDHQIFYSKTKCKFAKDFIIGDYVYNINSLEKIIDIEYKIDNEKVFDIVEVEDTKSFICNNIKIHNCLIVDERAFIPNNIWDQFISSVYPTISSSPDSKVIYVSTPNGLNHFYKDWSDSLEGRNEFNPIRVDWWEVPGRDEKWKQETIANIGQIRFNQEYGNEFFGSIATLIEPEYVKDLKYKQPIKTNFNIDKRQEKFLKIYEEPKPNHTYAVGVDSAKMTEENAGDALGMQVVDITSFPFKQVATFYAQNGISYLHAPKIICDLGNYYNKAYMFIENNEIGQEVANIVHFDYEYENTYFEKGNLPGYRTTKKSKRIGCSNLKLLIENNKIILNDFDTISQLSTFIRVKDSYKAESGYQDDLIMSLIASLYVLIAKGLDIDSFESASQLSNIITNQEINEVLEEPFSVGFLPEDDYEDHENDPHGFGKWW